MTDVILGRLTVFFSPPPFISAVRTSTFHWSLIISVMFSVAAEHETPDIRKSRSLNWTNQNTFKADYLRRTDLKILTRLATLRLQTTHDATPCKRPYLLALSIQTKISVVVTEQKIVYFSDVRQSDFLNFSFRKNHCLRTGTSQKELSASL